MRDLTPEQQARQQIDAQLQACGWTIQDFKAADLSAGRGIALREVPLTTGPCDVDHLQPEYEKLLAQIAATRTQLKAQLMEALSR